MTIAIPYPPIGKLGLVSDRRTAALIAADGSVAWWCLPNLDGAPALAALVDATVGGFFRVGPDRLDFGQQSYELDTFGLTTRWQSATGTLEVTDVMAMPGDDRAPADVDARILIRRVKASGSPQRFRADLHGSGFTIESVGSSILVGVPGNQLRLWTDRPVVSTGEGAHVAGTIEDGEEAWLALASDDHDRPWSSASLAALFQAALDYWRGYAGSLSHADLEPVRRAALVTHALTFAETGAVAAAATIGLPERIGGSRNYDYRFCWVRDSSLAMAFLARCGKIAETRRYLEWLSTRQSAGPMPLQVAYRLDGGTKMSPAKTLDLNGYRSSRPVQVGNPVDGLYEIDTFGYLADCGLILLEEGGEIDEGSWQMFLRLADFTADHWPNKGASIWEITPPHQFVAGKVMSWVTLDRTIRMAERLGRPVPDSWASTRDAVHADVCHRGVNPVSNAFRQHYETDDVDASLLLIATMGFLPADDARVVATIALIERELCINGHVQRFVASHLKDQGDQPLGEEEGSFLLCTCWLAHVKAMQGEIAVARQILDRVRIAAGETGLLPEGIDARSGDLLGNTPLVFTHIEYARAARFIAEAEKSLSAAS